MKYTRITCGVNDRGTLVENDKIFETVTDADKEWFASLYYYGEKEYQDFQIKKSVAGVVGLLTDKLIFDFDSVNDVEKAKTEANVLCERLITNYGFDSENIQIYFSGLKGFTIVVDIDKPLNSKELKNLCYYTIGHGLETLDPSIYNDSRIIRVPGTRHAKSGLYKIPIPLEEFLNISLDDIREAASTNEGFATDFTWGVQTIDPSLIVTNQEEPVVNKTNTPNSIDWSNKPKEWKNCKWSLVQGYYGEGKRNEALMVIVSTCRALGYDKETAYYMAKSSLKKREVIYGLAFDKTELWDTVIEPIYAPVWKGGQYTCKQKGWLQDYCNSLGTHKCSQSNEEHGISVTDVASLFQNYADNYEQNVLTTGIDELDDNPNCRLLVGTFNGLVAPPSSGKTSIALGMLEHLSSKNIHSIFFSYDMFAPLVYSRMAQRVTGLTQDEIANIYKYEPARAAKISAAVSKAYKNVSLCFNAGQTVADIQDTIDATEARTGQKLKLAIIDYNELIIAKSSDPVQASAEVAQKLRQLSHDKQICVLTLLQPSKLYSNPAEEIDNYKAAKGSSAISQAVTMMLGMNRPGFNPRNPVDDKFISIAAVKNRNGPLFAVDLYWDGVTGSVRSLSSEEEQLLADVRKTRDEKLKEKEQSWS